MNRNFAVVGLIIGTLFLTGCSDFSGDQYTASQVKSIQNVSYGTIVGIRDVKARVNQGTTGTRIGAAGGAVAGGLIGNALGGKSLVGAGIGALGGVIAGGLIGNRNVKVKEYTVRLDNGNTVAVTQGEPPVLALNQMVAVNYDTSGAGRIVPA